MPTQLMVQAKAEDEKRMVMLATKEKTQDPTPHLTLDLALDSTQWELTTHPKQYFSKLNYNSWDRYLQSTFYQDVAKQILNSLPLH